MTNRDTVAMHVMAAVPGNMKATDVLLIGSLAESVAVTAALAYQAADALSLAARQAQGEGGDDVPAA